MRYVVAAVLACLAGTAWAQGGGPGRVCAMFTPAEVGAILGAAVGPGKGQDAGRAGTCQWVDKDYEAQAILTVVGPDKYEEPSLGKGFKRLPGLGKKAWVAPDAGWRAGVLLDDAAILVNLDSKKMSEATAVAFLQEAVKRRAK